MKKDDRRQAILRTAIKALSETGYHGFSMNDLAKRCELTNAGLLHHFPSKDDLLVEILQERDRADKDVVSAAIAIHLKNRPGKREACLISLREIVVRNVGQPEIVRLYAILRSEALVPTHPAFTFFREREIGIIDVFSDLVEGLVDEPLSTARQISALMHGLEIQWLRESRIFDLVEEWDKVVLRILPPTS